MIDRISNKLFLDIKRHILIDKEVKIAYHKINRRSKQKRKRLMPKEEASTREKADQGIKKVLERIFGTIPGNSYFYGIQTPAVEMKFLYGGLLQFSVFMETTKLEDARNII